MNGLFLLPVIKKSVFENISLFLSCYSSFFQFQLCGDIFIIHKYKYFFYATS